MSRTKIDVSLINPVTGTLDLNNNALNNVSAINNTFIGLGRNRIINGEFIIDQANAGNAYSVSPGTNVLNLETWRATNGSAGAGVFTSNRQSSGGPVGFSHYMRLQTTTADASQAAAERYYNTQRMEGYNVRDCAFGTASAKTFTISFWVRSSLTGTFGVAFLNTNEDRSYVAQYTVNAANTWEQKSITVVGDTTGTWDVASNVGMNITFSLGTGTDFHASGTGSWQAGNFRDVAGSTKLINTLNATLDITGLQFEIGSVATTLDRRPFSQELALCQRYYEKTYDLETVPGTSTALGLRKVSVIGATTSIAQFATELFTVPKRVAPTMTGWNQTGTVASLTVLGTGAADVSGTFDITSASQRTAEIRATAVTGSPITVNSIYQIKFHWVADARL